MWRVRWRSKTSCTIRETCHSSRVAAERHYLAVLQYATWAVLEPLN